MKEQRREKALKPWKFTWTIKLFYCAMFFYKLSLMMLDTLSLWTLWWERNGAMNKEIKDLATATYKNYKNCVTEKIRGS